MIELIAGFTAGALVAALISWLIFRNNVQQKLLPSLQKMQQQDLIINQLQADQSLLRDQKEVLLERCATAETGNGYFKEQYLLYQQLQLTFQQSQQQLTIAKASLENAEEKLLLQKEELNTIGQTFQAEFRNMAQTIMEEKAKKFTEVNDQNMSALLSPLKTQLGDFKQKVEDTYDKESKERFSLGREIERLISMTQQVSQEANNLTTALKGNNKMQ